MALSGSSSYYLHRGVSGSDSVSGSLTQSGLHAPAPLPPGFRTQPNPNISFQSNVRDSSAVPTFPVENTPASVPHGFNIPSGAPTGEPGKKKRGRPRKYGPDGTNMSLGLSSTPPGPPSGSATPSESATPTAKRARGRPPGSGWKQQLAPLGEWMNNSAGLAFTPHVLNVADGEDIAAKILSFSQQRARAICILSANGVVSAVTLHQPAASDSTVTYEGRFQILCLSGSYLVAESGGPHNRSGGLSISLCTPDGHIFGGAVGGMLIAQSLVQVVLCSFVYGGPKSKNKAEAAIPDNAQDPVVQPGDESGTPASVTPSHFTRNSSARVWPGSRCDTRVPEREIDLTRG
ncbi:AT-hook motif nuclear-localized protein 5-like [Diospyros lotus]|uniref:AT-hook motif nuclear-localized protein 5-like n=1 Tax=Diospyros lotus TaxID=55363 RepID=UPI0022500B0A|nr:AT-hook motif nuclear-localized protein 5-like [Diospyros lotus]